MRAIVQRVSEASVKINDNITGRINHGMMVLLGIEDADTDDDLQWLAQKIINLRIFNDENGIMNLNINDVQGNILLVSQFTLYANTRKGNRPSYIRASKPEVATPMYDKMILAMSNLLGKKVESGVFGADMKVSLVNDGPVTIFIDTKQKE